MNNLDNFNDFKGKNFKEWFGASKMVDEQGNPLVCYHGTNSKFDAFKTGNRANDEGFYGDGFYFTFRRSGGGKGEASYYGKNVMDVFLRVEKPFDFSDLYKYKGKKIHFVKIETYVFLYNLAKIFPELGGKLFLSREVRQKSKYDDYSYETIEKPLSASELVELVDKYAEDLVVEDVYDDNGAKVKKIGFFKSKVKIEKYTDSNGNEREYKNFGEFGRISPDLSDIETECLLLFDGLEKHEKINVDLHPEGYMTRNPIITEAIKKRGYDGIIQSYHGDEVVVFNSNQIKSATDNNGNYSTTSDNIYEKVSLKGSKFNLEIFKALGSFNKRVLYCNEHLERMSSGSSRVAYYIGNNKVLKLAKNAKGIAQNEVEINYSGEYYIREILAEVFEYDEDSKWLIMEKAEKVTKSKFKEIVGISFDDYEKIISYYEYQYKGTKRDIKRPRPEFLTQDLEEDTELIYNISNYIGNYDIIPGDLKRLSTYGIVKRDGKEKIVLIDYGLDQEVYNKYYNKKSKY